MIPEAYLAISVPYIPIANPILAYFKAGASFDPSPVAATTLSNYLSPVTIIYLCYGVDLAKTFNFLATICITSKFLTLKTFLLTVFPSSSKVFS